KRVFLVILFTSFSGSLVSRISGAVQIGYEGLESGHGFRHEFSTIMNEHEWPADAIEVQLAHANGGSVRGIYNHAQYLDKRREMMQWWADWLDGKVE
ncbi:phage integrase family protein, partial [Escherichia coli O157:H7 str. TW14313]